MTYDIPQIFDKTLLAVYKLAARGWRLKTWVDSQNCSRKNSVQQGRNITSELISHLIMPQIVKVSEYKVANIRANVVQAFNVNVSYRKASDGRRKELDSIYGDGNTNIRNLPHYMDMLVHHNPNTRVVWKFEKDKKNMQQRTFRYVFWVFGPCVNAYQHTFPIVMVDVIHLHGSYKGKLMVAVMKTADN